MPSMPPPVADERSGLLAFLAQQRYTIRTAAYGLSDEQAAATPSSSALSVGGLIKHVALMERQWMATIQRRPAGEESYQEYQDSFRMLPGETLAGLLANHELAAKETDAVIAGIDDLGEPVPVPKGVPWLPQDVDAWSVRWVLLHLIEEVARHAGHADLVREAVDGATAVPLLAAVEGWSATPWVQPWTPTT
jgi:uncharacterized protein DUF664